MIYIFLTLLFLVGAYFVGWGALFISDVLGMGLAGAKIITMGGGVALAVALWVWAAMHDDGDRGKKG